MSRIAITILSVLLFLVTADVTGQTCTGLGTTQFSDIVYVSPAGQPTAAGTDMDPTDLLTGLGMLGGNTDKMYLQGGLYVISNALVMPSDVQLIGGFNTDWVKDNGAETIILRDANNIQTNPNRLVGIECIGQSNFRLQGLTIQVSSAQGLGTSVYGIYLNNCSDYELVRCKVNVGNAGNGVNGAPGLSGIDGAPGEPGDEGSEDDAATRAGGVGGCCSYPGSFAGGTGGEGGMRGTYEFPAGGQAFSGGSGTNGDGPAGGIGSQGGQGNFRNVTPLTCDRTSNNDGQFGGDGASGQVGTPGDPGEYTFGAGFFQPDKGDDGLPGTNGSAGGGGGGGGSSGGITWLYIPWPIDDTIPPNLNGTGPGGGGGGEGAQRGFGGEGGQGAGGAFGVFLWDNGLNSVMKDCEIEVGNGGIGGNGGVGGNGGDGGLGGQGGALFTACLIGAGGSGGDGGDGGDGGAGGKGSDGISEELYQQTGGQPLSIQNVYGLSQPSVNVTSGGCTNAPVEFTTNASGTIQWFFGAGSDPVSALGQEAVTSFSSPGFKTFTLVVNGIAFTYTDFIDIHAVVPPLNPEIQSGPTELCAGDIADFSSSISANSYTWQLRNIEGDTVVYDGPSYFDLLGVTFDTAGVYELTLTTSTECCGQSFSDTLMITVDSIVLPSIAIQTQFEDTTNTTCEQTEITFTATAEDVGSNPTYNWMVNGSPAGVNSPVFTTDQLLDQDAVTCEVTSSFGCASGEVAMSNSISVNVVPPVEVICAADSFFSGEPTFFESAITAGGLAPFEFYWTFGDGTFGFGDTVQHVYQDAGVYTATVEVTDSLGCSASCQTFMTISPTLTVDFDADTLTGCAPFTVQFTNGSTNAVTNYWDFGDGNSSTEVNPVHTYQTAGTYDVGLWVYAGTGNDSIAVFEQVQVNPTPTANFYSYEINGPEGGDTVQFADNSINATSWLWDFDDPSSSTNSSTEQNPFHVFSGNGGYDVSLTVSNIFGCTDSITIPSRVNVGIDELSETSGPIIYPNPASSNLQVNMISSDAELVFVKVLDTKGRVLMNFEKQLNPGLNEFPVDVTQLFSGAYVMMMNKGGSVYSNTFVVVKE